MTDWHLQQDAAGNIVQIWSDGRRDVLGKRDDVFTRWADFMGEDFTEKEWVEPENLGRAG